MRGVRMLSALAVLLTLGACGKSGNDDGAAGQPRQPAQAGQNVPAGVVLNTAQIKGLGITTVAVHAAQYRAQTEGYGTVVPLNVIAQADSDLMAARAVAAQSRAEADRDTYLFKDQNGAISRQTMEAAVAKADSDAAQVTLAARKAQAALGLSPPWDKSGRRAAIMARLASGALVLVQVSFPLGVLADSLPETLAIARLGGDRRWSSSQVWRAPANPGFPGDGVFALVAGSSLAQNEHVIAYVPAGAPQAGVRVPAAAVVYGEGESWVFVRKGADRFTRVRVDTSRVLSGGYFVPAHAGLAPGDAVVVGGAGLLLARALNPGAGPSG